MQGSLMMQGMGLIGSPRPSKDLSTKDHLSENVRRMRQIQKKSQQKEAEATKPVKALWKSDRYTDVPSRIKQDVEKLPSSRPASATFLRAHSRGSGPAMGADSRPCTPDASEKVKTEHHDTDFIKVNCRSARHPKAQRPPSAKAQDDLRKRSESAMTDYSMGEVPAYLKNRQKQWKKEEEERIASIPDPAMPAGHRTLPEQERVETLTLLQSKEKDLVRQLGALPIGTDTIRVRNKRKEMESKLVELEEAVRIFSRPKVFVRVDS